MKAILIKSYEIAPGIWKPPGTILEVTKQGARRLIIEGYVRDPNLTIKKKK